MAEKLQALLKSRRFWAAVTGLIVVLLPAGIDAAVVEQVVFLIAAWIVGDSINKTT